MNDRQGTLLEEGPGTGRHSFITGSRRLDLLAFVFVLVLMLLAGYRLRVYFRAPPARASPSVLSHFKKLPPI